MKDDFEIHPSSFRLHPFAVLALYIHLPFCRVRCAYCPFAVSTDMRLQEAYIDALLAEIDARGEGQQVDSIFFGG
jgi:oxygen-independent coproporphyrinogen-3 oxidase